MTTSEEDNLLLRYAGMLGHNYVAIAGVDGDRKTVAEVNTLDEAKRHCAYADLVVYERRITGRKAIGYHWVPVYDRHTESMAQRVEKGNKGRKKQGGMRT